MRGLILSPTAQLRRLGPAELAGIDGSLLVEHNVLGVCVAEVDGDVLAINERCLAIFGATRAEFEESGLRWTEIVSDATAAAERLFDALERGKEPLTFERAITRRDGTIAWALIGYTRVGRGLILCYVIDITRKRASEEAAAYILDASGRISSSLNEDEVLQQIGTLAVDRRFCDGVVLSRPEQASGCLIPHVLALEEAGKLAAAEQILRTAAAPVGLFGADKVFRTGNSLLFAPSEEQSETNLQLAACDAAVGEVLAVRSYVCVPIPVPERPYGTLCFFSSTRTFSEFDAQTAAEIGRRAGKQLEHANSLRAATETAQQLAKANADLKNFAAMVAHDLKSPLATIAGYLELMRFDFESDPELMQRQGRYLQRSEDMARRALKAIDGMLNLAFSGRLSAAKGLVPLTNIIAAARENLGVPWEHAAPTLVLEALPAVFGSASLLTLLFQNLLSNAVKYRRAEPLEIHVSARAEGDWWTVQVADNGVGFSSPLDSGLFDIFSRLEDHQDLAKGHGIGLATCRKIVEAHGGRIWSSQRPEPQRGAIFHFTLPAREDVASAPPEPARLRPRSREATHQKGHEL